MKKFRVNWIIPVLFFVTANVTVFFVAFLSGLKGITIGLLISITPTNWVAYLALKDYMKEKAAEDIDVSLLNDEKIKEAGANVNKDGHGK